VGSETQHEGNNRCLQGRDSALFQSRGLTQVAPNQEMVGRYLRRLRSGSGWFYSECLLEEQLFPTLVAVNECNDSITMSAPRPE
jgi:hypothetical protein